MFNRLIWESKGGASPTTVDRVPYQGLSLLLVLSVTPRDFSPGTPTVEQSDLKDFKDCRTSQRDTSLRLNIVPLLSGISLFIPSKQSDVSSSNWSVLSAVEAKKDV